MGVSSEGGTGGPPRRTVLTALPAALALAALAACTSDGSTPPPDGSQGPDGGPRTPSVDDVARLRTVATTRELLAAVTTATAVPAALRAAVADDHRAHLTALGATVEPPRTGSATGTGTGAAPASAAPAPTPPRSVVRDEADAAREALADVGAVGRELATLLVRVAAARAAHADLVARAADVPAAGGVTAPQASPTSSGASPTDQPTDQPTDRPTGTDQPTGTALPTLTPAPRASRPAADLDALARLVEAEHAAVFGYAVVVPRVRESRRKRAQALWDAHRTSRDVLEAQVVAAGAEPPAALPAYTVDVPSSAAGAGDLAASLEAGVARVAVWAAGRGGGDVRVRAANLAVTATRRRVEWSGTVPAFTE